MTLTPRAVLRTALVALVALTLAAGCSSSDDASAPAGEAGGETTTTAASGGAATTVARQSCSAATLAAAAAAALEAPALIDVVCETSSATATASNAPGGELILLFELQNGAWVLVGQGPVNDYATVAAPATFSPTAIPSWLRARNARLQREATPAPKDGATEIPVDTRVGPNGQIEECTGLGTDGQICVASTLPPPPSPDIPLDPDAPVESVPQSGFCKYNYNDPRCITDPGFVPDDIGGD